MRPRKLILIFSTDPIHLSTISFLLYTNFYRVVKAVTRDELVSEFNSHDVIDLVLIDAPGLWSEYKDLVEGIKRASPHIPVMVLHDGEGFIHVAEAMIKRNAPAEQFLDCVKNVSARKRGK